ncbi:Hcp family type VI secretion system effector [Mixta calida]|uniref:Hcp family type VI secretion system effector n=1 Tax=Mixta calida TaxID=665913 RepID=UPI0034D716F7
MDELYLRLQGITGESKDNLHQGWIDLKGYSWGLESHGAENNGTVNFHNLTVHALLDKATPAMITYASKKTLINKAELAICRAGSEHKEFCRITIENVRIAAIRMGDSGIASEVTYELEADKVQFQYWEQTSKGGRGAETRTTWNIKEHHA